MIEPCFGICCAAFAWTPLRVGEVEKIAEHLEVTPEDFRMRYVNTRGDWLHSLGYDGGPFDGDHDEGIKTGKPCPFWTQGLCGIQEVKPKSCANYSRPNRKCIHSWLERDECIRSHKRMALGKIIV